MGQQFTPTPLVLFATAHIYAICVDQMMVQGVCFCSSWLCILRLYFFFAQHNKTHLHTSLATEFRSKCKPPVLCVQFLFYFLLKHGTKAWKQKLLFYARKKPAYSTEVGRRGGEM